MKMKSRNTGRGAAAATALAVTLAASAFAQEGSLQDLAKAVQGLPQIVIYTAK
jgi:hypothetical protein